MTARDILARLYRIGAYKDILIPEFTFDGGRRIDALVVNTHKRIVRGYEIKVTRSDFRQDKKWQTYAEFCNLLYIVCPEGLIRPEEVEAPYGLIWIKDIENYHYSYVKKAKGFNQTPDFDKVYMRILELEMPRIHWASTCVKCRTDVDLRRAHLEDNA